MKRQLRIAGTLVLFPALALAATGCMGYAPQGAVATPGAPNETAQSRLPQLLSQLQGGGANLELFDQPTSEVAAAQQQGTAATPGSTTQPSNQKDAGSPAGPTSVPTTPRPGSTPDNRPLQPGQTPTPTEPPATATPTTPPPPPDTPTPTPTAPPPPTQPPPPPTPTPTIPTEGGLPTEG